ncbi:hypothetical protein SK128_019236 [Halocaridina rubra]|uniref:Uncharacterized protein n=1 Tax=Halocaridina rubra TaxID=373956 RepID=A0AAN8WKX1_HALRR
MDPKVSSVVLTIIACNSASPVSSSSDVENHHYDAALGGDFGKSEKAFRTLSSSSSEVENRDATGRLVFFDVNNIVNRFFRAFYLTGNANIIAPFNDVVVQTPVIGFVIVWLVLLALFIDHYYKTYKKPSGYRSFDAPFHNHLR